MDDDSPAADDEDDGNASGFLDPPEPFPLPFVLEFPWEEDLFALVTLYTVPPLDVIWDFSSGDDTQDPMAVNVVVVVLRCVEADVMPRKT